MESLTEPRNWCRSGSCCVFTHSMAIPYTQYLLTVPPERPPVLVLRAHERGNDGIGLCRHWHFGVIGATSAAVFGALALHGMRFHLARRFGCGYGVRSGFLWGMGAVLARVSGDLSGGVAAAGQVYSRRSRVVTVLWIRLAPLSRGRR